MAIGRVPCTQLKPADVAQQWHLVDGTDQVLGRLAVKIARVLMGKHRPTYTPHVDSGDFIVVTHVEKLKITGKKLDQRVYAKYTYYPGGYHTETMRSVFERKPERVLQTAVRRMLPKSALGRNMLSKLKVYRGGAHPHAAQQPTPWPY